MRKPIAASVLAATLLGGIATAEVPKEHVRQTFSHTIPNLPGKSLVAVEVTYPPAGGSSPHSHAPSAFIYARVLSGSVESRVGDAPARVYRAGESFYEMPGSHHRVSRNASRNAPARLLAIFVVDTGQAPLTMADQPEPAH